MGTTRCEMSLLLKQDFLRDFQHPVHFREQLRVSGPAVLLKGLGQELAVQGTNCLFILQKFPPDVLQSYLVLHVESQPRIWIRCPFHGLQVPAGGSIAIPWLSSEHFPFWIPGGQKPSPLLFFDAYTLRSRQRMQKVCIKAASGHQAGGAHDPHPHGAGDPQRDPRESNQPCVR